LSLRSRFADGFRGRIIDPLRVRILGEALKSIDASTGKGWFRKKGAAVRPKGLKGYYSWYENEGVVFSSINGLAEGATGGGFHTTVERVKKAKSLCDELGKDHNFDMLLPNITRNMLVAGFCPVERQINKMPSKCAFKIIHPLTITEIQHDGFEIQRVIQEVDGKKIDLEGGEIAWFINNQLGNDPRGISEIKAVEQLLQIKQSIIDSIEDIVDRYIAPTIIWKSRRDIQALKEAVQGREPGQDIFLGKLTEEEMQNVAQVIEVRGDAKFWEYIAYVDQLIYVGLYAPNLYYWRDATQASATVLRQMVDRKLRAIQRNVKRGVERGFFEPLIQANDLDEVPKVEFNMEKTGLDEMTLENIMVAAINLGLVGGKQLEKLFWLKGLDIGPLGYMPEEVPGSAKPTPQEPPK